MRVLTRKLVEGRVTKDGARFLEQLPADIGDNLLSLGQNGNRESVVAYFRKMSKISRILMENPASFEMVEMIYTGQRIEGLIDEYIFNSLSGQALRNRLEAVISYAADQVSKISTQNGYIERGIRIANLGSGSGRDTIDIFKRNPHLLNFVSVDCIDIDSDALATAKRLVQKQEFIQNFRFIQKNLLQFLSREEIDLGLMIGVLCGLESRKCVTILKKINPCFKKGGVLIASNVLKSMQERDPLMAYILGDVIGWKLVYKTPEELREIFEKAGYKWEGIFFDEPNRFHGMAIGKVV